MALLSDIRSGLLGLGSSAVGAGRSIGRGIGQGAGLLGQQLAQPLAQGIRDIPDVMRFYEAQRMAQPMMSYDPADLRPVTPMGVAGMLPTLRAAEQEAVQKPMLDVLKAQADLARARGAGTGARYKYKEIFQSRDNPKDFVYGVLDTSTGKYVDITTGAEIDTSAYKPSSAGIMGKGVMNVAQLTESAKELAITEGHLRGGQKFLDKLDDFKGGFSGKIDMLKSKFQTFFDQDLTPQQLAARAAIGDQEGLLGMFRTEVVGPGVLTEADAQRVMRKLGGYAGDWTAEPDLIRRAVQEVMEEKYIAYTEAANIYNQLAPAVGLSARSLTLRPISGLSQSMIDAGFDEEDWSLMTYDEKTELRKRYP